MAPLAARGGGAEAEHAVTGSLVPEYGEGPRVLQPRPAPAMAERISVETASNDDLASPLLFGGDRVSTPATVLDGRP